MRFFLMIFSNYGNRGWLFSKIYGPYENDRVAEEIERLWPNNKKKQFLVLDSRQLETLGELGKARIQEARAR